MLDPYEQWMVRSNLKRIADGEASAEAIVATLRANGYPSIADAVLANLPPQYTHTQPPKGPIAMSDETNGSTEPNGSMQITVVNVGTPRTITVEAGASVADALSAAGVDPESAIRFRGETINSQTAVELVLTPGEVVSAGPPHLSHG